MRLGQDVLSDSRVALCFEWLLANGLGGSASGTIAPLPRRPGHAHLTACGPHGRALPVLLGFDERVSATAGPFELDEIAAGAHAPKAVLEEFALTPWPTWRFRVGSAVFEKTLFPLRWHHAMVVRWRHLGGDEVELIAAPLIGAAADDAGLERLDATLQAAPGRVQIAIDANVTLHVWHDGAFLPARARRRLVPIPEGIPIEAVNAGHWGARLASGSALNVIASIEEPLFRALAREDRLGAPPPRSLNDLVAVLERGERERFENDRREARACAHMTLRQADEAHHGAAPTALATPRLDPDDPFVRAGADALVAGLATRGGRVTVLASLPSGEERGVDALRAVQALVTLRRFDAAREILTGWCEHLNEGLAPSGFDPDDGSPRYQDPSVALWLAIVGELYVRRSDDRDFANAPLFPRLEGVLHFYRSGTLLGLRVETDGLLVVDEDGARVARADLNALWCHAQIATAQLARAAGKKESAAFNLAWAHQHQRRFNEALWDDARGCLVDLVDGVPRDRGADPAQLWAACLAPSILPPERARRLVDSIRSERLTPFGLLDGKPEPVVRPEWLGPFCGAYLRAHDRSLEAQTRVRRWLTPLRERLASGLATGLPEAYVLEGNEPRPVGDTLSVLAGTELMRFWVEELDHAPEAVAR